jgi:general secretion pathway protein N
MRRLRIPWRWAVFAAAFLFSLVALLPLRLVLAQLDAGRAGLTAEEAVGSVWFGALGQARFGPVPLGDVSARLRFLPLLTGRARLDLAQAEGEGRLGAGLSLARHGFGIADASGSLSAAPTAGLPASELELDDVSVAFRDGLCASADGVVRARIAGPVTSPLSGEARCDGPALLLPLASQAGTERAEVRLFADGRYRADFTVGAAGAAALTRLEGRF